MVMRINIFLLFLFCIRSSFAVENDYFSLKKRCTQLCANCTVEEKISLLIKLTAFQKVIKWTKVSYIDWKHDSILPKPIKDIFEDNCCWYTFIRMGREKELIKEIQDKKSKNENTIKMQITMCDSIWESAKKYNLEAYYETLKTLFRALENCWSHKQIYKTLKKALDRSLFPSVKPEAPLKSFYLYYKPDDIYE